MTKPTKLGWLQLRETNNNLQSAGGVIMPFAAAAALNVGEAVWLSADYTVNKSTVATDHQKVIGVVVGGVRAGPLGAAGGNIDSAEPIYDPVAIAAGLLAANAGEQVLVCMFGECYVITDAAIAAGVRICPSTTTAGRVRAGTDPVVAAGATAVTSSAANGAIITGDAFARGVGKLLEASSGAGQAKRVFVNLF